MQLSVDDGAAGAVSVRNTSEAVRRPPAAAELWVGDVHGGGLPACVHALSFDDRRVGLWNFVAQPREARCTGCAQRCTYYFYLMKLKYRKSDRVSFGASEYICRNADDVYYITIKVLDDANLTRCMENAELDAAGKGRV